jgi:GDPmannose 4,6-dehydratase
MRNSGRQPGLAPDHMAKSLIVGCNGQDGRYLCELLQAKGIDVAGIDVRDDSAPCTLVRADIFDRDSVRHLLAELRPAEIYYLAAFHQSAQGQSTDDLVLRSMEINAMSLDHFLASVTSLNLKSRLFYAASSHVFGNCTLPVQDEETPFSPVCPYGISKVAGALLCRYYREQRGMYCSVGILYNHESPRRPVDFVSRKIVNAAVNIRDGHQKSLILGDLDAMVDWGHAPDYVAAMWAILQLDHGDDFVVASGARHSVREFVTIAFETVGMDWQKYVVEDRALLAKAGPRRSLQGDSRKLKAATGWEPQTSFEQMVKNMVAAELAARLTA